MYTTGLFQAALRLQRRTRSGKEAACVRDMPYFLLFKMDMLKEKLR